MCLLDDQLFIAWTERAPTPHNTTPTPPSLPHSINLPKKHRQVRGCKTLSAIAPHRKTYIAHKSKKTKTFA